MMKTITEKQKELIELLYKIIESLREALILAGENTNKNDIRYHKINDELIIYKASKEQIESELSTLEAKEKELYYIIPSDKEIFSESEKHIGEKNLPEILFEKGAKWFKSQIKEGDPKKFIEWKDLITMIEKMMSPREVRYMISDMDAPEE